MLLRLNASLALPLVCLAITSQALGTPFKQQIQRADVVLMPGWENQDVGNAAPLNASIVAWGEDAVWGTQQRRINAQKYRAMGVNWLAANVWMLTATKEQLVKSQALTEASCRDIAGDKLIPPWLDDGQSYWGCTNQPVFREQLRERVRKGMLAGANLLHLDDHLGTAGAVTHGGCFCDACMTGFNDWLQANLPDAQLRARGVPPGAFNYRDFLRKSGIKTRAQYQAQQHNLPLQHEYLQFQREAINEFVAELKALAVKTHGAEVPLGINAWNLVPDQLATSHLADYFSNEIKHYGLEASHPPYAYKLADGLGKPVFATAAGEGWSRIQRQEQVARVRHWVAMSYAFGHHFMYAFKQWAFDPEHGTSWYAPAITVYQPVTDFVHRHADLLNGYEPLAKLGLLYNQHAVRKNDEPLRTQVQRWLEASLQFRLVVAGDNSLQTRLQSEDSEGLEYVCRIDNQTLPEGQQAVFEAWQTQGKAGRCDDLARLERYRIKVLNRDGEPLPGVWALARVHPQKAPVLHLLNQAFDEASGAPQPQHHVRVALPETLLGPVRQVRVHQPDKTSLTFEVKGGRFTLPQLDYWAIVELLH